MNQGHKYVGEADVCMLMLEMPGYVPQYCGLPVQHPVHSGLCFHCGFRLEKAKGDGDEVCRFCFKHYSNAPPARLCLNCKEGKWHW